MPAKRLGRIDVGDEPVRRKVAPAEDSLGLLALAFVSDRPSTFEPDCCFRSYSPPIKDQI